MFEINCKEKNEGKNKHKLRKKLLKKRMCQWVKGKGKWGWEVRMLRSGSEDVRVGK